MTGFSKNVRDIICTVEGCERPLRARGYCATHWALWRRNGVPERQIRPRYACCTVAGCSSPTRSSGSPYCEAHYYRLRRTGSVDNPPRIFGTTCIVNGCESAAMRSAPGMRRAGEGYCRKHFLRLQNRGDASFECKGEDHPQWTGDAATNRAVHQRIRAIRGSSSSWSCTDCARPALHWSYNHTDPDERIDPEKGPYSLDIDHYLPRCASCHKRFDMAFARRAA